MKYSYMESAFVFQETLSNCTKMYEKVDHRLCELLLMIRGSSARFNLPFRAIQASPLFLCFLSSSAVTSMSLPPVPAKSFPDLVSLIHSMSEKPGFKATLFRGLPRDRT